MKPAFKAVRFAPVIDWSGKVPGVVGSFQSDAGLIEVEWKVVDNERAIASIVVPQGVSMEYEFTCCHVDSITHLEDNRICFELIKKAEPIAKAI